MKTHSDTPVQVEMRNALHLQPESHCLLRGEWVISCWRGWHARRTRLCLALRALVVPPPNNNPPCRCSPPLFCSSNNMATPPRSNSGPIHIYICICIIHIYVYMACSDPLPFCRRLRTPVSRSSAESKTDLRLPCSVRFKVSGFRV